MSANTLSDAISWLTASLTSCFRLLPPDARPWCRARPYRVWLALLRRSQPRPLALPHADGDFPRRRFSLRRAGGCSLCVGACCFGFLAAFRFRAAPASFSPLRFFSFFSGFLGSSLMPARFFRILVRSSGVLPLPRNCNSKNCSTILSNLGPRSTPSASSSRRRRSHPQRAPFLKIIANLGHSRADSAFPLR